MIGVLLLMIGAILGTRVIEAEDFARVNAHPARLEPGTLGDGEEHLSDEEYKDLAQQIDDLEQNVRDRQRARAELQAKIDQLQALIEAKQDELAANQLQVKRDPIQLDEPEPVRLVPDLTGFTVTKKPIFVEISAAGYLVQPAGRQFPAIEKHEPKKGQAAETTFSASAELMAYLKTVDAERDKKYLLLLLHPSGTEAYQNLRGFLFQEFNEVIPINPFLGRKVIRINLGVDPFSRDWQFISTAPAEKPE